MRFLRTYIGLKFDKSAIFLEVAFLKKKNFIMILSNCTIFPILSLLCLGGRQSFLERNGRKVVSHLFVTWIKTSAECWTFLPHLNNQENLLLYDPLKE